MTIVGEMEELPITGLEELEKHLDVVLEAPDTPLDAKLFDEVELQLNGRFVYISLAARVCGEAGRGV